MSGNSVWVERLVAFLRDLWCRYFKQSATAISILIFAPPFLQRRQRSPTGKSFPIPPGARVLRMQPECTQLALPARVDTWSLTSLQRLVETGGRLIEHARYNWLLLAESVQTRLLFGCLQRRSATLPSPAG